MSSIKEYTMSEHKGWFIQPTIVKEDSHVKRGEKFYSCDIQISNAKRDFSIKHTRLFESDIEAANSAYSNGRKLVDKHLDKYNSCMFYKAGWWLGGNGVFKGHVLEHDK